MNNNEFVKKKVLKFIKYIENKYGMKGYPLHTVLNKSLKYKDKYNLSDEEFEIFKENYLKFLNIRNNPNKYTILKPKNNMAKFFGENHYTANKIDINEQDLPIANQILTAYQHSKMNWQQVILQSITYNEDYLKQQNNNNNTIDVNYLSYVPPVIAAMFIPNIKQYDNYFLLTNLAYIFKCKYEGDIISFYPNMQMIYNLITDPTDIVCSSDSPIKDILNRILLQISLWKVVLQLRQGNFFDSYNNNCNFDFMNIINNCKLSTFDAPDLIMIGDENIILRRLLNSLAYRSASIFSYPTTLPLFTSIPMNYIQVSKIPILYIKLPILGFNNNTNNITLQDSLITTLPIMYNGESRVIYIAHTNGTLIISVPRRTYKPISNNGVFNFANMPHHAFGYEVLNNYKVFANSKLDINRGKQELNIKSMVVLKEKQENNNNFIIGSKTLLLPNYPDNRLLNDITNIDSVNITIYDPLTDHNLRNWNNTNDKIEDFTEKATIFIYVKNQDNNNDIIDDIDQTYILALDIKSYLGIRINQSGGGEIIDKVNKFEGLLNKISDKLTDKYILETKSEKIKEILEVTKLLSNKDIIKYIEYKDNDKYKNFNDYIIKLNDENQELDKAFGELEQEKQDLDEAFGELEQENIELEQQKNDLVKNFGKLLDECNNNIKENNNLYEEYIKKIKEKIKY
jgi:hypothetical protein